LESFGDISGLTWNKRTGQLVSGHQRLRALREKYGAKLKLTFVGGSAGITLPTGDRMTIRTVDWDLNRQRLANLAANNPHIAGAFTAEVQPQLLELLKGEDAALQALRLDLLIEKETKVPVEFLAADESIETEHECPKCHYRWSGGK
jgi:hypothetical protein